MLTIWYAQPLSLAEAHRLRQQALQRQQRGLRRGQASRVALLMELIATFWLEVSYTHQLHPHDRSAHFVALESLIWGQLMMSRRQQGAHQQLAHGFKLAVPLLSAAGYLMLMQRHQRLNRLPLAPTPLPAATLQQLCATAGVIEQLSASARRTHPFHDPTDVYG